MPEAPKAGCARSRVWQEKWPQRPRGLLHGLSGSARCSPPMKLVQARTRAKHPRERGYWLPISFRFCRRSTSATRRLGYGPWHPAGRLGVPGAHDGKRPIAVMGDGGFWHNGLTSGIGNAVFNRDDNLTHRRRTTATSAATGGQDIPSSVAQETTHRSTRQCDRDSPYAGVGVNWVRTIDNTYNVRKMRDTLARPADLKGTKVRRFVIAQSECMLNKQPPHPFRCSTRAVKDGKRMVRTPLSASIRRPCTGGSRLHPPLRAGPSLTVKPNPDPLKIDPIAHVDNSVSAAGYAGK